MTERTPTSVSDAALIAQLWVGMFQQIASIAIAALGGLLVLLETGLVDLGARWWVTAGSCALTAVVAMVGQSTVVDAAGRAELPGRDARIVRGLASGLIGGSIYMICSLFF